MTTTTDPRGLLGEGPKVPHLAVVTTAAGDVLALPVGSKFFIVPDPTRTDRTLSVFLAKLTRETMTFRCNCGNPKCTRVYKYVMRVEGMHPPRPER